MKLIPMPSPNGTNYERLFINASRGAAYDAKRGLGYDAQPEPSPAAKVAKILVDCLSQDELNELGREVVKARDASLDPYATRAVPASEIKRERNSGGSAMDGRRRARIAQDGKFASVLRAAFKPGATAKALERKHAMDAAITGTIEQRSGSSCSKSTPTGSRTTPESARRIGFLPRPACSNATRIWPGSVSPNSASLIAESVASLSAAGPCPAGESRRVFYSKRRFNQND